jgi:hypothetical protein
MGDAGQAYAGPGPALRTVLGTLYRVAYFHSKINGLCYTADVAERLCPTG